MYKHKLTDVPENLLSQPKGLSPSTRWQSDYNVAAWFRFDRIAQQPLRLFIQWQDTNGEHAQFVDQISVNAASLLLSGIARLKVTGPLKNISVVIESDQHDYRVDELFVQPAPTTSETARKVAHG